MTAIGASVAPDDLHSGYFYIPASKTVVVKENKQMTTWGVLDIDGSLVVDGQSILEP